MKTPKTHGKRKMTHRKHNNEHGYEHMNFSSSHEDEDESVILRCILSMEQTS